MSYKRIYPQLFISPLLRMIERFFIDHKRIEEKRPISLPNRLTILRLTSIPLVLLFLSIEGRVESFFAAFFFSLAFLTDILDGFIARRYQSVTALGKFLDPLADKLLVIVTLIKLLELQRVPGWIVILMVIRELIITGLRGIAAKEGVIIQANRFGKYKTTIQAISITALCLHYEFLGMDFHRIGIATLWIALIFTLGSGIVYIFKVRSLFFESN